MIKLIIAATYLALACFMVIISFSEIPFLAKLIANVAILLAGWRIFAIAGRANDSGA